MSLAAVLTHAKPHRACLPYLAHGCATAAYSCPSSLLTLGDTQDFRDLTSPLPSGCRTASLLLKSHSPTASAAPAASFKRPYQNCPERILAHACSLDGAALIGSYRLPFPMLKAVIEATDFSHPQ